MENRNTPRQLERARDSSRNPLTRVILIAAAAVVLVIAGVGIIFAVGGGEEDTVTYVYEVSGTAETAHISYNVGTDKLTEVPDAALPWRQSITDSAGWAGIRVKSGTDTGKITCRILLGGKVVDEETAIGSATCTYAD